MIVLFVPGEPSTITAQQKGISWKKRVVFTKSAVKAEARRIRRNLLRWNGTEFVRVERKCATPLLGPVQCSIKIRYPLTQQQARRHAERLSDRKFEIRHGRRPDFDNSIKLLLDVLTERGFWLDDGQISDANIHKRYGSEPGIHIAIQPQAEAV